MSVNDTYRSICVEECVQNNNSKRQCGTHTQRMQEKATTPKKRRLIGDLG